MHVYIYTYIYIHSIKQVLDSQMASRVLRFALHIAILACSVRALPRCARAFRAAQMHDAGTRQASHAVARGACGRTLSLRERASACVHNHPYLHTGACAPAWSADELLVAAAGCRGGGTVRRERWRAHRCSVGRGHRVLRPHGPQHVARVRHTGRSLPPGHRPRVSSGVCVCVRACACVCVSPILKVLYKASFCIVSIPVPRLLRIFVRRHMAARMKQW